MNGSAQEARISTGLTLILAAACGLIVANLYYAQPLVGPISQSLGLSPSASGLIVTLTQIGYGLGLLLIVPLGDLVENRRLILIMLLLDAVAVLGAGLLGQAASFLTAALLIGLCSVAVQIIVPYASAMVAPEARGRVVGNVVSGLLFGIMFARPVASLIASVASWHAVFFLSAAVLVGLAVVLARTLPERRPAGSLGYFALLASMKDLALHTPVLQRRAAYQAGLFAAFSLFWTVTPLELAGPEFGLSQRAIALFALAGAAGAIAAPIAGRLADLGLSRITTRVALIMATLSFLLTYLAPAGSSMSLALFTLAAILLDAGVSTSLVLGQRAIYTLGEAQRGRLNGLFMATFFMGGALGSALGAYAYAHGGWLAASLLGLALPAAALAFSLTEKR
ncbi:MFS transporter [Xaviernesmea oryzae]|uniref:MFS transporter n=1 Tax=Xaviernesmea oryzae TaxID=464029 RepID=A0A1Q9AUI3_9HYPH|nr:MFS transporter [Xaviernesmea oryzae]OLP59064.1 MFS transporter [Xaviernesmea oryzae]SEK88277.1 Predicted arabinose efflux permease, MFS family [Xaviernesmea oryzae]